MHQSIGKKKKLLIYLAFLIILSTISGKYTQKQKTYSLKINKIKVTGLSKVENLEIENDLNGILYKNILIVGKEEINLIINKYNIVEEYNIKKIYPSSLNVNIKPAKLLAKVNNGHQLIVGSNGKLISNNNKVKNLPQIFGKFNSIKFLEFKQNVEKSKFDFAEFKTIYFFPSNRCDILTVEGVLIKLPESNIYESLDIAYKIIASTKFKNKKIIDLRIKSHLIVK
jgi:cell division protein FtsQ